jgi:glycosyltransferase involved in cell wall biosynthesis
MVILEAMAFNVVPISTNVGEISEFINEKNRNGFLIENSVDEQKIVANFVEKIIFLKNNIEILEEYSSNTFTSLNNKFSPLSFENAYKDLFFNIDFL